MLMITRQDRPRGFSLGPSATRLIYPLSGAGATACLGKAMGRLEVNPSLVKVKPGVYWFKKSKFGLREQMKILRFVLDLDLVLVLIEVGVGDAFEVRNVLLSSNGKGCLRGGGVM